MMNYHNNKFKTNNYVSFLGRTIGFLVVETTSGSLCSGLLTDFFGVVPDRGATGGLGFGTGGLAAGFVPTTGLEVNAVGDLGAVAT